MPQPRRPATPPPTTGAPVPSDGLSAPTAGALAAGVAAVPATAVAAQPTQTGVATVAQIAAAAAKIIAAFLRLLLKRGKKLDIYLRQRLLEAAPDMPEDEVEELARLEKEYEAEFQRKVRERLKRDLPKALRIPDETERRRQLQIVLDREKRLVEAREKAMIERALGAAERRDLKKTSPQGAFWKLSETVREHTVDCLAMGQKFWPWEVLGALHPPRHHGCPCRLIGLDQAKRLGLMTDADIPDPAEAVRRAARLKRRWEDLEEGAVSTTDPTGPHHSGYDSSMVGVPPEITALRSLVEAAIDDEEPVARVTAIRDRLAKLLEECDAWLEEEREPAPDLAADLPDAEGAEGAPLEAEEAAADEEAEGEEGPPDDGEDDPGGEVDDTTVAEAEADEEPELAAPLDLETARRRVAVRDALLAEGRFTEGELEEMGLFSAERLDAMEADGSIEEALEHAAPPVTGWAA